MRELFAQIDTFDPRTLQWNIEDLGISKNAFEKTKAQRIQPHKFFAHPDILTKHPRTVAYYRNLVAISQKGMSQLGFPTGRFERASAISMNDELARGFARTLNGVISNVIEQMAAVDIAATRDVAFAELGTELQGTWANVVGKGAAKAVEEIIATHISESGLGIKEDSGTFKLVSGWTITFASEPDIRFVDPQGIERIVIEIKGSLDKNGAQSRYGEAKKTFAKALVRNPRCYTVYLASCFTQAVEDQIKIDGQVRDKFNLIPLPFFKCAPARGVLFCGMITGNSGKEADSCMLSNITPSM
ncbi:MAG: XcyI family restriction endonuclease, partial [Tepidisphaeraceae bacterium]